MKQIVLVGFMGAGKTTIGQLLAKELTHDFYDLDQQIAEHVGMTIPAYFVQHGEAAFRQQETALLRRTLSQEGVIATGGGLVTQAANRQLLRQSQSVIYLATDPLVALERIKADGTSSRPIAQQKTDQEMLDLFTDREQLYLEVADVVIDTSKLSLEDVVTQILAWKG